MLVGGLVLAMGGGALRDALEGGNRTLVLGASFGAVVFFGLAVLVLTRGVPRFTDPNRCRACGYPVRDIPWEPARLGEETLARRTCPECGRTEL